MTIPAVLFINKSKRLLFVAFRAFVFAFFGFFFLIGLIALTTPLLFFFVAHNFSFFVFTSTTKDRPTIQVFVYQTIAIAPVFPLSRNVNYN